MAIPAFLILLAGLVAEPLVGIAQHVVEASIPIRSVISAESLLLWGHSGGLLKYEPFILFFVAVVLAIFSWLVIYRGVILTRRDVTWNCGTVPTLRQQYSGTGFSKPVRRAFDFLLKPRREVVYLQKEHKYFGRSMVVTLTIPDRFTEKLYIPLQHHLVKTASFLRRIQEGSVRIYIGYVMVAMVLVLIWGAL